MQGRLETELKLQGKIEKLLADLPDYVNEWHINLKASRKTAASRMEYVNKVYAFLYYLNTKPKTITVEDITLQAVESYLISIQTKTSKNGMIVYTSDSYQQEAWCILNSFLGFLCVSGYIKENYMKYIAKPKNNDLQRINENRILLTKKDFNKIIKAAQDDISDKRKHVKHNNRDVLILLLFMTTGMRKTALSEINISDYDPENHTIKIVDKGNKTHIYPLNDTVVEYMDLWLEDRKHYPIKNKNALFLKYDGERLEASGIVVLVKKYSEKGLGYKISPHKLRAGFCSVLYEQTHDIEFVRRAVGHSNVRTTQRYIKTNDNEREEASKIMSDLLRI